MGWGGGPWSQPVWIRTLLQPLPSSTNLGQSLCLSFLICKEWMIILPTLQYCFEV